MNHIHRTINRYHQIFESYRGVITLKSIWVWLSMLSLLCFLYSFFWYINDSLFPKINITKNTKLFVCMVFEILTLSGWFKLQKERDNLLISRLQKELGTKENNIDKLKSLWFDHTLGYPKTSYLRVAEDIDKMMILKEKYKSSLKLGEKQFFDLIFSSESKNRMLAMMLAMCAATIGLSIAGGANINYLFSIYEQVSIKTLLLTDFLIALILMFLFLILKYILLIILLAYEIFFEKLDGLKSTSHRRASAFIQELIRQYQLEKAKVKTKNQSTT